MALVGRGGQGDVGQRIRDEILVIQVYGSTKLMELNLITDLVNLFLYLLSFVREIITANPA